MLFQQYFQMADLVISDGYHDVGYTYINVDDCWLSHERDRRGRLQADPLRFPSGMGALADYVSSAGDFDHSKVENYVQFSIYVNLSYIEVFHIEKIIDVK